MTTIQLPPIIGHRGVAGYAPENTIAAIEKAKSYGLTWVEFDVMLTRCNVPILIHDHTLKRTTNGRGKVVRRTFQPLKDLDAGSWFSKEFAGEPIPTLVQVVNCLQQQHLQAVIEIKPHRGQEQTAAYQAYRVINQYWPQALEINLFASFSIPALQALRTCHRKVPIGLGLQRWRSDWHDTVDELDCSSIHINHRLLSDKRVKDLKASHCWIMAYTVNRTDRAKQLFDWGIDGVFTDYPDQIWPAIY